MIADLDLALALAIAACILVVVAAGLLIARVITRPEVHLTGRRAIVAGSHVTVTRVIPPARASSPLVIRPALPRGQEPGQERASAAGGS